MRRSRIRLAYFLDRRDKIDLISFVGVSRIPCFSRMVRKKYHLTRVCTFSSSVIFDTLGLPGCWLGGVLSYQISLEILFDLDWIGNFYLPP